MRRKKVLADVNVFGFRFADGKFVAADGDFNGISQGRYFADEELRAFGYPHIHDAPFNVACPGQLADGDRIPAGCIP